MTRADPDEVKKAIIQAMWIEGFAMDVEGFKEKNRQHRFALARQVFCFMMWNHYNWGCQAIGAETKQHHSTIIYSYAKASQMIEMYGSYGRVYLCACGMLGITPAPWMKPNTTREEVPNQRNPSPLQKKKREPRIKVPEGEYVVPVNWTPEERESLRALRRGELIGYAKPKSTKSRAMSNSG